MWGTPVARDDQKSPAAHRAMKQRLLGRTEDAAVTSLTVQVKEWPTPTAHDYRSPRAAAASRNSPDLPDVVRRGWPTPQAGDAKIGAMTSETAARQRAAGHQEMLAGALHDFSHPVATTSTDGSSTPPTVDLNPEFVAALMGLPRHWLTPSTSEETDSYREWLLSHSLNSPGGSDSTR